MLRACLNIALLFTVANLPLGRMPSNCVGVVEARDENMWDPARQKGRGSREEERP